MNFDAEKLRIPQFDKWTPDDEEEFRERAAIMEYCGNKPRDIAVMDARACVDNKVWERVYETRT